MITTRRDALEVMVSQSLTWSFSWTDGWVYGSHELERGVFSSFFPLTSLTTTNTTRKVHAREPSKKNN